MVEAVIAILLRIVLLNSALGITLSLSLGEKITWKNVYQANPNNSNDKEAH